MKVPVVRNILEANDRIAEENRVLFDSNKLYVLNLMSSPGAGKTTLLIKTIELLKEKIGIAVIEGDIQSSHDAEKIAETGVQAVQINTDGACHLDANMIREAAEQIEFEDIDLLVVENVGNLVCPAEFNVGEDIKAMILSVPEGDDKPLKYPLMFQECGCLVINKIDLLPYINTDVGKIREIACKLNPNLDIFEVSCQTGEGLDDWCDWLMKKVNRA